MSNPTINLPMTDEELAECPIGEQLHILTKAKAADILNQPIEELERSFITFLHLEHLHHMFQRCSTANYYLLTPNICAELFTYEQCHSDRHYIAKRLVGAILPGLEGKREGLDVLWRQVYRKLWQLERNCKAPLKMFFIYDTEPNCIYKETGEAWRFHDDSPIYIRLKKLYKTLSKLEL